MTKQAKFLNWTCGILLTYGLIRDNSLAFGISLGWFIIVLSCQFWDEAAARKSAQLEQLRRDALNEANSFRD